IRTPGGTVLHTGDWKIDPTPILRDPTDEKKLRALGEEGGLALVGDSTNARRDGRSPSEADVAKTIAEIVRTARGRVAVSTFASNVARLRAGTDAPRAPSTGAPRCCTRGGARARGDRPRDGACGTDRARDRLSRRRSGFPADGCLRLSAAETRRDALHPQPTR